MESPDITFLTADFPVFWEQALGCLVTDVDGNTFLDATSSFGALGVGHRHPRVVAAIHEQADRLIHGMGDVHPSDVKVLLLEKIAARAPIPSAGVILGQNGSDAVEAALKTAVLATGNPGVLAFQGGYHGLSYGALEITARPFFREPFRGQLGHFAQHLPFSCAIGEVREAILRGGMPIGAVIVEPIQGRGGMCIPPAGWLAALRTLCTEFGVLLILDEIFTGWGRTGSWFACEQEGVLPDLLCVGKGMGGGMPISACLGSQELLKSAWGESAGEARHTSTFLGHPLSCAASLATIAVLEEEGLVARSAEVGKRLLAALQALAGAYPEAIKEARGRGLMIGLEFHDSERAGRVVLSALRLGLIVLPAGDRGEVVEIVPPFVIDDEQADWCIEILAHCLKGAA
ncbi:MAG TPA: aspartate aminotransferase family protein [Capsulimonadaceae bacterium]|nr:aspartate aminotransferase family protein [Capsulimonadaceae bacterium]